MLDTLPERFTLARKQQMPHQDFLVLVLSDEASRRDGQAATIRAQSATDRFTNNSYDLVVEGESYRPRMKPRRTTETEPHPQPASSRSRRRGGQNRR